ncbi:MAG: Pyrroline-5-carboxylate reductase [Paracidovorax wautersii]|uniref:Pyrroline-5-carboxylate reductase n=1 Tax=Paracidovorax wautersii TaxID=1177982 RepID=A0A7V8JPR4_9BURK|nr:MAG: Pyrroline-5-carboxylate reductase [Paracidovorax wautersii]
MTAASTATPSHPLIAFIGGGNMASAIIGGLVQQGHPGERIVVVAPTEATRGRLAQAYGVRTLAAPDASLGGADLVVWAVKPQMLQAAAQPVLPFVAQALHLSVAAGIGSDTLARWLQSERVVRAMPNTPALVGQGMTGLYARPAATSADRTLVERTLQPTGQLLWLDQDTLIDAVTAVSGSGPAYVFYFMEAIEAQGVKLGLSPQQAHQLALATFAGATALAAASDEPLQTLRQRVTSKGGTTFAAISSLKADGVAGSIQRAVQACQQRARELGAEFGRAD